MLKRKYIFETKSTRATRVFQSVIIYFFVLFIVYSVSSISIILYSQSLNSNAVEAYYQNPPDLIVVFTGDKGRIPLALTKSTEYKQPNLFITGVYTSNTVDSILKLRKEYSKQINSNLIEIDYDARNTVENTISTLRYLRKKKNMKNVLIISHDYHILRIKMLLSQIMRTEEDYVFQFMGVNSYYKEIRTLKIVYKEVYKIIRTSIFLLLWDQETPVPAN
jgi:uncharacterized SAM-binding protein YcdF (DUF218 family)